MNELLGDDATETSPALGVPSTSGMPVEIPTVQEPSTDGTTEADSGDDSASGPSSITDDTEPSDSTAADGTADPTSDPSTDSANGGAAAAPSSAEGGASGSESGSAGAGGIRNTGGAGGAPGSGGIAGNVGGSGGSSGNAGAGGGSGGAGTGAGNSAGDAGSASGGAGEPPLPDVLTLLNSFPPSGAVGVAAEANIELVFDRDLEALSGSISVLRAANDSVFESAMTTASKVTIAGSTLSIDLDGMLGSGTTYYVVLDQGAVQASDGSGFDGISKSHNLSFTTAAIAQPGDITSGMALWFDASAAPSLKTNGASVEIWGDRSGNNYSLWPASSDERPTLVPAALAGKPVLRFDGGDMLGGPLIPTFTEYDVFVVWQSSIAAGSGYSHIVRNGINMEFNHGHPDPTFRFGGGSDFDMNWVVAQFNSPEVNIPYLWNLSFNATADTLTSFTDGVQSDIVSGISGTPMPTTASFAIGGAWAMVRYFTGDVAEVVIFNRALSSGERTSVAAYLMAKWGI